MGNASHNGASGSPRVEEGRAEESTPRPSASSQARRWTPRGMIKSITPRKTPSKDGRGNRQVPSLAGEFSNLCVVVDSPQDGSNEGPPFSPASVSCASLSSRTAPVYQGQTVNGLRDGHGMHVSAQGAYEGQWKAGHQEGVGKQRWVDGRYYAGEFHKGLFHGEGFMTWTTPQGALVYTGQYVNNLKHGKGTFCWPDGRIYEGEWGHGRRSGHGLYTNQKGQQRTGIWKDDKLERWDHLAFSGGEEPTADKTSARSVLTETTQASTVRTQNSGNGRRWSTGTNEETQDDCVNARLEAMMGTPRMADAMAEAIRAAQIAHVTGPTQEQSRVQRDFSADSPASSSNRGAPRGESCDSVSVCSDVASQPLVPAPPPRGHGSRSSPSLTAQQQERQRHLGDMMKLPLPLAPPNRTPTSGEREDLGDHAGGLEAFFGTPRMDDAIDQILTGRGHEIDKILAPDAGPWQPVVRQVPALDLATAEAERNLEAMFGTPRMDDAVSVAMTHRSSVSGSTSFFNPISRGAGGAAATTPRSARLEPVVPSFDEDLVVPPPDFSSGCQDDALSELFSLAKLDKSIGKHVASESRGKNRPTLEPVQEASQEARAVTLEFSCERAEMR